MPVEVEKIRSKTVNIQSFLDSTQYSVNGVTRYERVFGEDFISTGGRESTEEVLKLLHLRRGQRVLDVGCGIGGSAFMMASQYGAIVEGIDLSTNVIRIANDKLEGKYKHIKDQVSFSVEDAVSKDYPEGSFDVVYSRDTFLHIKEKEPLFHKFHRWLKPGGRLLVTDYCLGETKTPSQEYTDYVASREYHLLSVTDYAHIFEAIFPEVWSDDRTEHFLRILKRELDALNLHKDAFLKDFSESDFNALRDGWERKIVRTNLGEQAWALFLATK